MQLILCPNCTDVFRPSYKKRSCLCGRVNGRLLEDSHTVKVHGQAQIIELDDLVLHRALATVKYTALPVPVFGHLIPREPGDGRFQPDPQRNGNGSAKPPS